MMRPADQKAAAYLFATRPARLLAGAARHPRGLLASVAALLLAACNETSVGYVEIRTFPGFFGPLYLNSAKIDPPRNGSAILQQDVGKTTLGLERNGILLPVCEFDVRANRIITVTVSTIDRLPRCDVQN